MYIDNNKQLNSESSTLPQETFAVESGLFQSAESRQTSWSYGVVF